MNIGCEENTCNNTKIIFLSLPTVDKDIFLRDSLIFKLVISIYLPSDRLWVRPAHSPPVFSILGNYFIHSSIGECIFWDGSDY